MEINKTHYRVGSIFWLVVGIYALVQAFRLGLGHVNNPGAGFIFFWAASFLIILAVIDLVVSAKKQEREEDKKEALWAGLRWRRVLLVVVVLSTYIYFLNSLGFWISTFLLLVFLYKWVEPAKWWISVVGALITLLLSFAIFKLWLAVEFPKGFLGI